MRALTGITIIALALPGAAPAQDLFDTRVVTIGVVQDGPRRDGRDELIEQELAPLVQEGTQVVFKRDPAFNANWDPAQLRSVLQTALDDPGVDIVLASGAMIGHIAARVDLSKPVVCSFVERMDLFRIHDMEDDRSTQENLSFVLIAQQVETDLRVYRNLVDFDTLDVALAPMALAEIDLLETEIRSLEQSLGIHLRFWPVTADTARSLAGVPPDARVLLTFTPQMTGDQRTALIQALTARKIPTFSLTGHEDVERGALAARIPDLTVRGARRVALNLSEIIRGRPVSELPVMLSVDPVLLLNGRTAAAIGYSPDLQTLSVARILHESSLFRVEEPLTLARAFQIAETANFDLAVATQDVETAKQDKNLARSPMFPQIHFHPNYRAVDAAALGLSGFPDHSVNLGISATQMIYNDQVISGFRSQSRLLEGTAAAREAERLNTLGTAGHAYYLLVLARILHRVQADNVALTEQNLEISRLRLEVGYAGRDEVFRWETELARQRSGLLDTRANIQARQVDLNKVLARPQSTLWTPEEAEVDPQVFPFLDGRLNGVFTNTATLPGFRESLVQFALVNSPELKSMTMNQEAQEIQLGQRQRQWWLPAFGLNFDYRYQLYRDPDFSQQARALPVFEVRMDYPIFLGAARSYEVKKASAQLLRLGWEVDLVKQNVEQSTRNALAFVEASFPAIELGAIAADRAQKNLAIVQDKYAQGLVNIVDLIDAQNQSFTADQNAAAAIYKFLLDLLALQRAVSWFEEDKTPEEQDELVRFIQDAIAGQ